MSNLRKYIYSPTSCRTFSKKSRDNFNNDKSFVNDEVKKKLLEVANQILSDSEDVGERFADEMKNSQERAKFVLFTEQPQLRSQIT